MFDTVHKHGPSYPQEVTHKLAPTAEHLRLLDEFRKEARQRAEERIEVPTITLGDITSYQDIEGIRILFKINEYKHSVLVTDMSMLLRTVGMHLAEHVRQIIFQEILLKNSNTQEMK